VLFYKTIKHLARTWKGIILLTDADFHFQGVWAMDKIIVILIIAAAAAYVIRRFCFKKGSTCGCGCSGCGGGNGGSGQGADACNGNDERRL
jgi:hypothetical protein